MAIGQNFYGDQAERDIANLSQLQSTQAMGYGNQAAAYADPFMGERRQYQTQLSKLMANPGEFSSSPAYKFAYDQGLEAINRKGGVRSGAKLAQLMQYGQGMASQQYQQQAKLLSDLAMSGSSPAAAGLAYSRGADRSQDYAQLAAAARASGQSRQPSAMGFNNGTQSQLDQMMAEIDRQRAEPGYRGSGITTPKDAFGNPLPRNIYGSVDTPGEAGWINTADGPMRYTPSGQYYGGISTHIQDLGIGGYGYPSYDPYGFGGEYGGYGADNGYADYGYGEY